MPDYNKTMSPPEGTVFLETKDGLKYWLHYPPKGSGRNRAVHTEDPSISLHEYRGMGREAESSFLLNYQGSKIGFVNHTLYKATPYPGPEDIYDREKKQHIKIITMMGTPVQDVMSRYMRNNNGLLALDSYNGGYLRDPDHELKNEWLLGFDWKDYNNGKRSKFKNRQQQEEVLSLLPDIYFGLKGVLGNLAIGKKLRFKRILRFDKALLEELNNGILIDE